MFILPFHLQPFLYVMFYYLTWEKHLSLVGTVWILCCPNCEIVKFYKITLTCTPSVLQLVSL